MVDCITAFSFDLINATDRNVSSQLLQPTKKKTHQNVWSSITHGIVRLTFRIFVSMRLYLCPLYEWYEWRRDVFKQLLTIFLYLGVCVFATTL